jgi:aminoglycoside phosphotransferase (APT) family kinase protein
MTTNDVLPFVAAPVADVAAATDLAGRAAHAWGLPEPTLLRVGMNALFAAGDDVVVRVGRPTGAAVSAPRLAVFLADAGLRVPRYLDPDPMEDDGLVAWAVRREAVVGEVDWAEVGEMVAHLHRIDPARVRGLHPLPAASAFPWWQFDRLLADVDDLLDPAARRGIVAALEQHGDWAHRGAAVMLCHGDVHPGNVVATAQGAVLLDWDLLCTGPAAWDHAPLMTWTQRWGGAPGLYEAFADGYGRSMRGDDVAEAVATLRLVAATLMRLRAGRHDEAARDEAERRLRWWRGDADAPAWHAQ